MHLALADSYLKLGKKKQARETYKKAAYGRRAPGVRAQAYQNYKRLLIAAFEKEIHATLHPEFPVAVVLLLSDHGSNWIV